MDKHRSTRIGSRGSSLAMAQAHRIQALFNDKGVEASICVIQTVGDTQPDPIHLMGGKGVFVKDIEQALLDHDIDVAVHSFKDITSIPDHQLIYSGFVLEERPTDAIILFDTNNMNQSALRLATGSMRRKALCQHLYPNIECISIRGNIDTRIEKAKALNYDGLILSTAGLQRLKMTHLISYEPDPIHFVPAPGQGMLAIQNRKDDAALTELVASITTPEAQQLGRYYVEFLKGIEFNCNHPLGAIIHNQEWRVFLGTNRANYFNHPLHDVVGIVRRVKECAHA